MFFSLILNNTLQDLKDIIKARSRGSDTPLQFTSLMGYHEEEGVSNTNKIETSVEQQLPLSVNMLCRHSRYCHILTSLSCNSAVYHTRTVACVEVAISKGLYCCNTVNCLTWSHWLHSETTDVIIQI